MSYHVRIDSFDGPFDLLLYLVSRQRVDIGSISVTEIVDQYLAYVDRMQELDLDVASDFLLVASTLLQIKASSLVPKPEEALDEEFDDMTPDEARHILAERLIVYKQYKNAAAHLAGRFEAESLMHPRYVGPDPQYVHVLPDFLKGVTLERLATLCARAMARREEFLLESEHIAAKPIAVEGHVRSIHKRISVRKHMKFSEILEDAPTVPLRVVSFLAVLELYKRTMITMEQEAPLADIDIDFIEGSGELVFDEHDEEEWA